jgi:hypothetical protein
MISNHLFPLVRFNYLTDRCSFFFKHRNPFEITSFNGLNVSELMCVMGDAKQEGRLHRFPITQINQG